MREPRAALDGGGGSGRSPAPGPAAVLVSPIRHHPVKKLVFILLLSAALLALAGGRWLVDGLRWTAGRVLPAPS